MGEVEMSTQWVSFIASGILFFLALLGIGIGALTTRNISKKSHKEDQELD